MKNKIFSFFKVTILSLLAIGFSKTILVESKSNLDQATLTVRDSGGTETSGGGKS